MPFKELYQRPICKSSFDEHATLLVLSCGSSFVWFLFQDIVNLHKKFIEECEARLEVGPSLSYILYIMIWLYSLKISMLLSTFAVLWSAVAQLVECYTRNRRFAGSCLAPGGVTVLCHWARHFIHCLVLVQPRKTCPNMTEKLLTGM